MSYEAFGELLARNGQKLQDFMQDYQTKGIDRTIYGKIKIIDWEAFANEVFGKGFDRSSQEYLDAYSAYVDSMIAMQDQETANIQKAMDQMKNILSSKVNSKVNVSYIQHAFEQAEIPDALSKIAKRYGVDLRDGILTINSQTNIPGLVQAIATEAQKAGVLLPEQLAELTDAVADMIKKIIELIQNGISGNLSRAGANELVNWANDHGIEASFIETADGLKLTAQSMTEVYDAMKGVDSLQAQSLLPNIIEANDQYNHQ